MVTIRAARPGDRDALWSILEPIIRAGETYTLPRNDRAVRLWQRSGFEIVGRLPKAFLHPTAGYTDAYVMYREL